MSALNRLLSAQTQRLIIFSLPQLAVKPWLIPPSPSIYLTNCKIIDTTTGTLLDGLHNIQIKVGKFEAVSKSDGFEYEDQDAVKVDLEGKFVCPGLIDAHVHVTAVPGTSVSREFTFEVTHKEEEESWAPGE